MTNRQTEILQKQQKYLQLSQQDKVLVPSFLSGMRRMRTTQMSSAYVLVTYTHC